MNVTRKLFCCATFICVYLMATSTDTISTTASLTFDRQRHLHSMCLILCRYRYLCFRVDTVKSKLRCNTHGVFRRTYFFSCTRNKETLSGHFEDLSKKKGSRPQERTEEKQVKASRRDKESKGQSEKCKGSRRYKVRVVTGRLDGAGTSCNIHVILNGTVAVISHKLQRKGFDFYRGSVGDFMFHDMCVGKLRNIKVKIVKKGIISDWAWNLNAMNVTVTGRKYVDKYVTNPKIWLGEFKRKQTVEIADLKFTHLKQPSY